MAHNEQVFTPKWVVNKILDEVGYNDYDKSLLNNMIIREFPQG